MIAPKHAVMIDDPIRAITCLVGTGPEALAHPSRAHAKRGQRRQTKFVPVERPVSAVTPVTCSTCRMTYLPSTIPPASTSSEDWVCDICQKALG